ncbi:MAG: DEAD/DEAH box helicase [Notoacmeibacter sp.]|nr:DEAD/DEAH box helicase [Notoacmeibacter sp.]
MLPTEMIAAPLSAALQARGFSALTPVQAAMLEQGNKDADLLVSAQTGSGKTVAFGIALAPLLLEADDRMDPDAHPQALVIAPTRELAMQVRRELEWLYGDTGATFGSCIGGMDYRREIRALERGAHIVVGTPGRLRDHLTRGTLDISDLRAVVLDEADEMLDLGFREDLEFILDAAPEDRRTLLFSATVPAPIAKLAKSYQKDAVRVALASAGEKHGDIAYHLMPVHPNERDHAIINTLLWFDSQNTIIFCQTREAVRHMASRLHNRGFSVVALSGELSQAERTNALQAMRDGRARVCVATDVAARGIDLPNLDLVIHADLPSNPETLLHRSGRTGRAGRKGVSVVIAPWHRRRSAERVLKMARVDALFLAPPDADAVDQRQNERMLADPDFTIAREGDDDAFIARLLEAHSPEQIAAAWLRRVRRSMPSPEDISVDDRPAPSRDVGERPAARFEDGVWFSLSIGRKHKADPRWILPIICKAGGVTRKDVGSIRILDEESRFEVSASVADAYGAAIAAKGTLEKGMRIAPFTGDPADGVPAPNPPKGRPSAYRKGGKGDFDAPRGDFKKKKWQGERDAAPLRDDGETAGDWRGRQDKPFKGKSGQPFAGKGEQAFGDKPKKPFGGKAKTGFGKSGFDKPRFDEGKPDYAAKGGKPYADKGGKPSAKKPHRKGKKPNG